MDTSAFDNLTRLLGAAATRRQAVAVLLGSAASGALAAISSACGGSSNAPTPTPTPSGNLSQLTGSEAAAALAEATADAEYVAVTTSLSQSYTRGATQAWRLIDRGRTMVVSEFGGGPNGQQARVGYVRESDGRHVAYGLAFTPTRVVSGHFRGTTGRVEQLLPPLTRPRVSASSPRPSAPGLCSNCVAVCQTLPPGPVSPFAMCNGRGDFDNVLAASASIICAMDALTATLQNPSSPRLPNCEPAMGSACEQACSACMPNSACAGLPSVPSVPTICCPFVGQCCAGGCCPTTTVCITTGTSGNGDPVGACCTPLLDVRC